MEAGGQEEDDVLWGRFGRGQPAISPIQSEHSTLSLSRVNRLVLHAESSGRQPSKRQKKSRSVFAGVWGGVPLSKTVKLQTASATRMLKSGFASWGWGHVDKGVGVGDDDGDAVEKRRERGEIHDGLVFLLGGCDELDGEAIWPMSSVCALRALPVFLLCEECWQVCLCWRNLSVYASRWQTYMVVSNKFVCVRMLYVGTRSRAVAHCCVIIMV